jgi:uncharacterized protein YeaO (DUF488 family)
VPKAEFARLDFYDVWFPNLSPSAELLAEGRASTDQKGWDKFLRQFRSQMNEAEPSRVLDLLAALSHQTNFSLGCYCQDESRCHRSILKKLLTERGASLR